MNEGQNKDTETKETAISLEGNDWVLPSEISAVDLAEETFQKRLAEAGWTEDEIFDLSIGFREALVNAVAHGNLGVIKPDDNKTDLSKMIEDELKNNPLKRNKKVNVNIDLNKERVYIRIKDEGNGFNVGEVSDPTYPENLMKTKGRGLLYMRTYYDSVEFVGKGNEVIVSKERK